MTWLDNTQVELTRFIQVAEQSQPNHTSRSKHYRCIIIISYLPFGYLITHRTYLLFQMTNNLKEIDMEDSEEVAPNIDSSDVKQLPCGGRICPLNLQFLQNK